MFSSLFANADIRNKAIDLLVTHNMLETTEALLCVPAGILLYSLCYYLAKREPLNRISHSIDDFLEEYAGLIQARR